MDYKITMDYNQQNDNDDTIILTFDAESMMEYVEDFLKFAYEHGVACDIKSFMAGFVFGTRFIIGGVNQNIPTLVIEDPSEQLEQLSKKLHKYQPTSM